MLCPSPITLVLLCVDVVIFALMLLLYYYYMMINKLLYIARHKKIIDIILLKRTTYTQNRVVGNVKNKKKLLCVCTLYFLQELHKNRTRTSSMRAKNKLHR